MLMGNDHNYRLRRPDESLRLARHVGSWVVAESENQRGKINEI